MTLPEADASAAYATLQAEISRIRKGAPETVQTQTRFADYAVSLLERKVREGKINSAKARERWGDTLELHLLPFFGDYYLDQIRRADVIRWKDEYAAKRMRDDKYAPTTANGWLSILKVVVNAGVQEFELDRNPVAGIEPFDTSTHETYTEEEPNSLTVAELPRFLAKLRELYPQHFGMVALGFATGLRPSTMRPLRRSGPTPDILWDAGVLLVRRSQTRNEEVMRKPKTGLRQRLMLPADLVDILRWHAGQLKDAMAESELLFPSDTGGFRSASCLDKPFREVAKAIGLTKKVTPRAMRRTFQDLARAAQVNDLVTRAVSGHATDSMQRLYSTVSDLEVREGLAKVVSLAGFKKAHAGAKKRGGVLGGVRGAKIRKASSG